MVSHGYEHEEERRRKAGIPTRRWYECHGCGAEYPSSAGARPSWGCTCGRPDIHIHSDLDGEQPMLESVSTL
jgi:hypothetical protein